MSAVSWDMAVGTEIAGYRITGILGRGGMSAVYRAEEFLKRANPPADAKVDYGARDEHCWSGDHDHVNAVSRLTYNSRFIRLMADRWTRSAPPGADTKSWKY